MFQKAHSAALDILCRRDDHGLSNRSTYPISRSIIGSRQRLVRGRCLSAMPRRLPLRGLEVSEWKRLRALEAENAKLKRLLADAMLDNTKKW